MKRRTRKFYPHESGLTDEVREKIRKNRGKMIRPKQQFLEAELQVKIAAMKVSGMTLPVIAKELNIELTMCVRLLSRAWEEYLADRDVVMSRLFAQQNALYDRVLRVWGPRAFGGSAIMIDRRTGKERTQHFEPDAEAMRIVLRSMRDRNVLIGHGMPMRHEITGANGGPVTTSNIDEMEAARLVRNYFATEVTEASITVEAHDTAKSEKSEKSEKTIPDPDDAADHRAA